MKNKDSVGRRIYAGAEIFNLVNKPIDVNHKAKEKELRIEKLAMICMPKSLVINEVKKSHAAGGAEIYQVNGGSQTFPGNYKFVEEADKFDFEKQPDAYFPSYKEAIAVANAQNESEIIRLTIIQDDLIDQIKCLVEANKTNINALPLYEEEED